MNEVMKIALTNLGAYNEGTLRFTWLSLPASEEDIEEAMEAIGIGESNGCGVYEEWFITDYECEYMEIGEYDDIDYLNDIAWQLDALDEYDLEKLEAYMEVNFCNDITNALDRIDDCVWYPNQDLEELAEELADEWLDCYNVPDFIRNYFDYKAFARDLRYDNYYEVKGGTIWIA